jgi:hypothetical protein
MDMPGRIPARAAKLAGALLAATAAAALAAGTADAALIYNNQPTPKPKNLSSIGFEATSTSEFGGQVEFAGTNRTSPTVSVLMSSWACQNLQGGAACATTPHSSFSWPITLNVYDVGPENSVGALISSTTESVNVPFRPSAGKHCPVNPEGDVGYGSQCYHGLAFKANFSLAGVTLPSKAIISVAYNTSDYGYAPTHEANVGEDSLNVALSGTPSVGTDPLPEDAYINSTYEAEYGGLGTPGTFSIAGEWAEYQPVFKIQAKAH